MDIFIIRFSLEGDLTKVPGHSKWIYTLKLRRIEAGGPYRVRKDQLLVSFHLPLSSYRHRSYSECFAKVTVLSTERLEHTSSIQCRPYDPAHSLCGQLMMRSVWCL